MIEMITKETIAEAIHEILKINIPFKNQLQGANELGFRDLLYDELYATNKLYKKEYHINGGTRGSIDIARMYNLPYVAGVVKNVDRCIELGHYSLNQAKPQIVKYLKDRDKRINQGIRNIYLIGIVTFIRDIKMQSANFNSKDFKFIDDYVGKNYNDVKRNCTNSKKRYMQIDELYEEFKKWFDDDTILIKQIKTVDNIEIEMNFIISKVNKQLLNKDIFSTYKNSL